MVDQNDATLSDPIHTRTRATINYWKERLSRDTSSEHEELVATALSKAFEQANAHQESVNFWKKAFLDQSRGKSNRYLFASLLSAAFDQTGDEEDEFEFWKSIMLEDYFYFREAPNFLLNASRKLGPGSHSTLINVCKAHIRKRFYASGLATEVLIAETRDVWDEATRLAFWKSCVRKPGGEVNDLAVEQLTDAFSLTGDDQQSIWFWTAKVRDNPKGNSQSTIELNKIFVASGHDEAARLCWANLAEKTPEFTLFNLFYADAQGRLGNIELALDGWKTWLEFYLRWYWDNDWETYDDDEPYYLNFGYKRVVKSLSEALEWEDDTLESIDFWRRSLNAFPRIVEDPRPECLANALLKHAHALYLPTEKAQEFLEEAARVCPENKEIKSLTPDVSFSQKEFWRSAITRDSASPYSYLRLVQCRPIDESETQQCLKSLLNRYRYHESYSGKELRPVLSAISRELADPIQFWLDVTKLKPELENLEQLHDECKKVDSPDNIAAWMALVKEHPNNYTILDFMKEKVVGSTYNWGLVEETSFWMEMVTRNPTSWSLGKLLKNAFYRQRISCGTWQLRKVAFNKQIEFWKSILWTMVGKDQDWAIEILSELIYAMRDAAILEDTHELMKVSENSIVCWESIVNRYSESSKFKNRLFEAKQFLTLVRDNYM